MNISVSRLLRCAAFLAVLLQLALPARASALLMLGGAPTETAWVDSVWQFAPMVYVQDVAASELVYSAENLPPWMGLDPHTGTLIGMPGPQHVGTYDEISITMSGGGVRVTGAPFSVTVAQRISARSVLLQWVAPGANRDGTPLEGLGGYVIYSGTSPYELEPLLYVFGGDILSHDLRDVPAGEHFFAVSAFDTGGMESDLSPVVSGYFP
jgi:hypothetical protein